MNTSHLIDLGDATVETREIAGSEVPDEPFELGKAAWG